jgi:hypothetical protein
MKKMLCSVLVLVTCLGLLAAAPEEKVPLKTLRKCSS